MTRLLVLALGVTVAGLFLSGWVFLAGAILLCFAYVLALGENRA